MSKGAHSHPPGMQQRACSFFGTQNIYYRPAAAHLVVPAAVLHVRPHVRNVQPLLPPADQHLRVGMQCMARQCGGWG